jgi:methionyl-tRNA synthetase
MPDQPKKFYVTTPIYYVNARPHIGHAYTTIVADVLARRHRLLGDETFFLTGTDEHGQKIERSAAAAGVPPQEFTDQVSAQFRALWDRMGLTYDRYIRTTDDKHKRGAQHLFSELYKNGQIYLDSYTGSYCVSDEAFVDAPAGTPCPDCGRLLETITEENFFFRLSAHQQPLLDLIESNQLLITPEAARNEVLSFIRGGLRDLSVSRSSFTWGIPVPEPAASESQQKHVIYVWLDALANYMTAVGYGSDDPADQAEFARYWPADLHLVGKEITRFHCVYWPAFLMAAGLPTPKAITANGWLLFDNAKMSKSRGNVVRTETILDAFGTLCPAPTAPPLLSSRSAAEGSAVLETAPLLPTQRDRDLFASDVLRYYLLREIPFGQDGSFSFDAMITRYNADLANGYGNLVSRTLKMIETNFAGSIPVSPHDRLILATNLENDDSIKFTQGTDNVITLINISGNAFDKFLSETSFTNALAVPMSSISAVDRYISDQAPWKLAKSSDPKSCARLAEVLYLAAESIRIITAQLYPILPYATARVWAQLGLGDIEQAARNGDLKDLQWGGLQPGTKLGSLAPIFPRADKGLAQIMIDMETPESQSSNSSKLAAEPNPSSASTPATAQPDAGPRTASLDEPSGTLTVGGSTAATTGPDPSVPPPVPAAEAPVGPADSSPQIAIDDFIKIELRVAQVILCERIPKADKLLRLEVDLGYERRQILSGIAEWYTPEEMVGRRIIVITNLAPRKMRGLESHGMLLAASEEGGKPFLATVPEGVAVGTRLK